MTLVLIVDDKAIFREPIAACLRGNGYETICANDGAEALDLIRRRKPALVLLDVAMPNVDGLEALRRWRDDVSMPRCPVILLTAVAERDYVIRARELGVHNYLLKSRFSLDEMLRRIERALEEARGGGAASSVAAPGGPAGAHRVSAVSPERRAEPQTPSAPKLDRRAALEAIDAAADLRAMSPIASEVARMARGGRASVDDVAEVIRRDPVVALRILKLANSSAYSRGDRVDTVKSAVIRIGLGAIGQAVMNLGVVQELRDVGRQGVVDPMHFWAHSIATGLISAMLARRVGDGLEPDAAFTTGLLHDLGRLMMIEAFPDQYKEAAQLARDSGIDLVDAEQRVLRVTHAEATERVLTRWKFPRDLVDPISLHHEDVEKMRRSAGKRFREAAALALADRLAHCAMIGDSGMGAIRPIDELARALQLDRSDLARIVQEAAEQTDEMKFAMLSISNQEYWPSRSETVSATLDGVAPRFVEADESADGVGVFTSRLRCGADGRPALLATVRGARDRAGLEVRIRQAEEELGVTGAPLVLIAEEAAAHIAQEIAGEYGGRVATLPITPEALAGVIRDAADGSGEMREAA